MIWIIGGLGLWGAGVGALTSFVWAAGARSRRADDAWYQRQAEARLTALRDEQRRYAEAVTALVAEDAVREAEAIVGGR